jgi:hypothetical protein
MSFLRGTIADETGINLKGYCDTNFSTFEDFNSFETFDGALYAPAPDDNVVHNIKNKYIHKIRLLEDSLKKVEVEILLEQSPALERIKEATELKIKELKKQMITELDDHGIDYFVPDQESIESSLSKSVNNIPNHIVKEYTQTNDVKILKNYREQIKKDKKKEPLTFDQFIHFYYSDDSHLVWNSCKDDLVKQIELIRNSKKKEFEKPIYQKNPDEITKEELEEYLGRPVKNYEFPVRDLENLLLYKFQGKIYIDNILNKIEQEDSDLSKDWDYFRPILRRYNYLYKTYINDRFYIDDQAKTHEAKIKLKEDISKGFDIEYQLREEFSRHNMVPNVLNNVVKWYLLDNPGISFEIYLELFKKIDEFLPKDFLIAKDYIFGNYSGAVSFKEFKKGWVYSEFQFIKNEPSNDGNVGNIGNIGNIGNVGNIGNELSDSESETDTDTRNLRMIFDRFTFNFDPNFLGGIIIGILIQKLF